jgi:4-hydroxythreonine-4-phosphate dehydrogenase
VKRPICIAITTGDHDGIGSEVVSKALRRVGPVKNVHFFLWRSSQCPKSHLKRIDSKFKRLTVTSWPDALKAQRSDYRTIIDINSPLPPAKWVETSAHAAMFGKLDGLATGPLSKTSIHDAGFTDLGHTEILRRVAKVDDVHMAFIGAKFSVVLATGHMPLRNVPSGLTAEKLESAIHSATRLLPLLEKSRRKKPIAVVGLNPHAGERGLIGSEEAEVILPVIEKMRAGGINLVGPLVPDAAFLKTEREKYAAYVCSYHDQGLIPFKMTHGQDGVHLSLGLPFVRTSVDHGTAKNLFGQNRADESSMVEAVEWAIKLCQDKVVF